jgi:hypothetical protein
VFERGRREDNLNFHIDTIPEVEIWVNTENPPIRATAFSCKVRRLRRLTKNGNKKVRT